MLRLYGILRWKRRRPSILKVSTVVLGNFRCMDRCICPRCKVPAVAAVRALGTGTPVIRRKTLRYEILHSTSASSTSLSSNRVLVYKMPKALAKHPQQRTLHKCTSLPILFHQKATMVITIQLSQTTRAKGASRSLDCLRKKTKTSSDK